jgi:flagellar hook-associated protein 3 FlgL
MTDTLGSPLAVSPQTAAGPVLFALGEDDAATARLELQLSTGYKVNSPSDDPAEAVNVLRLRSAVARANQYVANAEDGLGWLQQANATMNQVLSVLQQVRQLVLSAGQPNPSGSLSLDSLATQVEGARAELVDLANTTYGGQPIFGGAAPGHAAYDQSGNWLGSGAAPTRTVAPGVSVPIALVGPAVFGSGSSGLLGDVPGTNFGVLAQISSDLRAGNTGAVLSTDLAALDSAINQATAAAAQLGSYTDQLQAFEQQAQSAAQAFSTELSGAQDVNLAKAATELQMRQNTYQAALWATSKLVQTSLVEFLS